MNAPARTASGRSFEVGSPAFGHSDVLRMTRHVVGRERVETRYREVSVAGLRGHTVTFATAWRLPSAPTPDVP